MSTLKTSALNLSLNEAEMIAESSDEPEIISEEEMDRITANFKELLKEPAKGVVIDGNTVMKVGKHKGKLFEEILKDEGYCRWILKLEDCEKSALKYFRMFLDGCIEGKITDDFGNPYQIGDPNNQDSFIDPLAMDNYILDVGKHKGKRFIDILKNQQPYCVWLFQADEVKNDQLKRFKTYLKSRLEM